MRNFLQQVRGRNRGRVMKIEGVNGFGVKGPGTIFIPTKTFSLKKFLHANFEVSTLNKHHCIYIQSTYALK